MKRLVRGEKGYILILALLVLVVVGLISGPVLSYMVSGLRAGHVFETGAAELYAADAGVEDAVLRIQLQDDEVKNLSCGSGNHSLTYPKSGDPPLEVNGKNVVVTINWTHNTTKSVNYVVESTATSDGSATRITAYVSGVSKYGDYTGILGQVITAFDQLELPYNPNVIIDPPVGEEHGPIGDYADIGSWPEEDEVKDFYGQNVSGARQYTGATTINLKGTNCPPGPIYINGVPLSYASGLEALYIGGELMVNNSVNPQATLRLDGTLYVKGNMSIKPTKEVILDLNGNTIFVEGSFEIDKSVGVKGPGCIITIGDITFKPGIQAGGTDPVFVMSVSGTTHMEPSVNFYGCIAGKVLVDIDPSAHVEIRYPDTEGWYDDLNFLTSGAYQLVYGITSWDVSRQ